MLHLIEPEDEKETFEVCIDAPLEVCDDDEKEPRNKGGRPRIADLHPDFLPKFKEILSNAGFQAAAGSNRSFSTVYAKHNILLEKRRNGYLYNNGLSLSELQQRLTGIGGVEGLKKISKSGCATFLCVVECLIVTIVALACYMVDPNRRNAQYPDARR